MASRTSAHTGRTAIHVGQMYFCARSIFIHMLSYTNFIKAQKAYNSCHILALTPSDTIFVTDLEQCAMPVQVHRSIRI